MAVMLILVDGMRPDSINMSETAQTLRKEMAYTLEGSTVYPSVTLPCHVSLVTSNEPDVHELRQMFLSHGLSQFQDYLKYWQKTEKKRDSSITGKNSEILHFRARFLIQPITSPPIFLMGGQTICVRVMRRNTGRKKNRILCSCI